MGHTRRQRLPSLRARSTPVVPREVEESEKPMLTIAGDWSTVYVEIRPRRLR